jgi:transcription termination/antitermination protein NusA
MSMVALSDLKAMIDAISEQKKLPTAVVEAALREALLKGYERYRRTLRMGDDTYDEEYFNNVEVELDIEGEGFRIWAVKTIVETVENPDHEVAMGEVLKALMPDPDEEPDPDMPPPQINLGEPVSVNVTPDKEEFGRMAAIQTKQVLAQKLRDHQRKLIQEEFQDLEDPVLNAKVLRFERQSVILSVSSGFGRPEVEAELPKKEQLPNDNYRANATFRVFLKEVSEVPRRGPQLIVSRANAGLVVYLFENEVPEIQDEIVRIVAVAREANPPSRHVGPRTKIAVDTTERDVDPVGACIGSRGSRIQVVVNELRGEKIDVIRWSPDPGIYIANALSPARVDNVVLIDPDNRQAHVLVPEDQLSLAIGKEGQNVRLAARLTGWKIDIKDVAKYDYDDPANRPIPASPPQEPDYEEDYEEEELEAELSDDDAIQAEDDGQDPEAIEAEESAEASTEEPIEEDEALDDDSEEAED